MKRIYSGILASLFLSGLLPLQAQTVHELPAEIKDGNILHCFDWKMSDITSELPTIAEAGFTAVQLSPLQRNVASGVIWSDVYRPFDFSFKQSAGLGTAEDLKTLCSEAERYGIKVIVDVVFNHTDKGSYHDSWWNQGERLRSGTSYINYGNRYSITHDLMGDFPDVNTEDPEVIARAKAYIEELKSYGVKGIRFDAAKHIGLPSEGSNFWKEVTSVPEMFYYGEILGTPGGSSANSLMKEYSDYMCVTDEEYSTKARNNLGVPTSSGNWTNKGIDGSRLVYWGETHDTFSNTEDYGGVSKNTPQNIIDRAYATVASRSEGIGLYFSRPSSTLYGNIKVGQKGSMHFKDPCVAEVNKFKNAMIGKAHSYSFTSAASSVTRQGGGAVIVSKSAYAEVEISNGNGYCPPGEYYDRVSGNKFTVTSTLIKGKTGGSGIAVIYGDFVPDDDFDYDEGIDDSDDIYVYCTNPGGWDKVYVYMYSSGGAAVTNGGWPGVLMTKIDDVWEYKVPQELWYNSRVIFNDGKNSSQYPGKVDSPMEDGYLLNGKTMISDGTGNNNWKEYDNSDVGIDDVFTDQELTLEDAQWFNMQGLRVPYPASGGVYIVVSPRGKSKKILIP